ncbi:MAG: hypothetical protein Q7R92_05480 [bacterium]|nr:hypothetical protein [bacterium]
MTAKIITNIALIISLAGIQIFFISSLPGWLANLNLVLVVLIIILGFLKFDYAIWWSVGAGMILEIFSFLPFGTFLFSLSLTILAANILLNYFFTNRSLYSFLALVALATVIYKLIIRLITFIFAESAGNAWQSTLKQIGLNLLFTFFIFYLVHFFSRNFKPEFLIHPVK